MTLHLHKAQNVRACHIYVKMQQSFKGCGVWLYQFLIIAYLFTFLFLFLDISIVIKVIWAFFSFYFGFEEFCFWKNDSTSTSKKKLLHVLSPRKEILQQGYQYHKLRKAYSKFYRRHYKLVSKFNVGLKTLLHQGLSEPEFYGDLVYKLKKKKVGRADFSDQFRKIIVPYKCIGYCINIMRHAARLVFNPITVNNFASLFNCTAVGRASDSMMAPT